MAAPDGEVWRSRADLASAGSDTTSTNAAVDVKEVTDDLDMPWRPGMRSNECCVVLQRGLIVFDAILPGW